MNIMMWVLAGGAIGWAAYALLHFNEFRGMPVSVVLGAAGGFLGGKVLTPMLTSPTPPVAEGFDTLALFVAAVSAASLLAIGNLVHKRFGV
jgi:uncharacterized membrane protein YeaQ/YmgE (transglycosylase-associated protein family)